MVTKKQNIPREIEIVEENSEPLQRAVYKKYRNSNRKLLEIAELEKKNDLKPDQIDKVSKKEFYLAEKNKYEEMTQMIKETMAETEAYYEVKSERKFLTLFKAIAIAESKFEWPGKSEITAISQILAPAEGLTINERVSYLNQSIVKMISSPKLEDKIEEAYSKYGEEIFKPPPKSIISATPKKSEIVNQEEKTEQVEEKVIELKIAGDVEKIITETAPKPVDSEPSKQTQESNKQESSPPAENVVGYVHEAVNPAKIESSDIRKDSSSIENKEQEQHNNNEAPSDVKEVNGQYQERSYKKYKGNRGSYNRSFKDNGEKRNYRGNEGEERERKEEKRYYKPKHETEENGQNQDQREDEFELPARFGKAEIKRLEEEGYIPAGKPKPKPTGIKQRFNYEHGHKYDKPNYRN